MNGRDATVRFASAVGPQTPQCSSAGGACSIGTSVATCPAGYGAISGGWVAGSINDVVVTSVSQDGRSWVVIADNEGPFTGYVQAYVTCVSVPLAAYSSPRLSVFRK